MIKEENFSDEILLKLEEAEQNKINGNFKEALNTLNSLLKEDPSCIPALEEVSDIYLSMGKKGKAKEISEFILTLSPNSYSANYIIGFIHSSSSDFSKSIIFLEQANKIKGNNPEILRCLGWSHFSIGNRKKGILLIERAVNLFGGEDIEALCDLIICHGISGNLKKALTLLKQVSQNDAKNPRVLTCINVLSELTGKKVK